VSFVLERTLIGVTTSEADRARFSALFHEHSAQVYAYARRHCEAADAQDVVADTFLVAWRRFSDVPEEPLPWLLVIARHTISNRNRQRVRQFHLTNALGRLDHMMAPATAADGGLIERETVLGGLAQLSDLEREALLLVGWDGLSNSAAAKVAGCSVRAFEVRLSRARARLRQYAAQADNAKPADPRPTSSKRGI